MVIFYETLEVSFIKTKFSSDGFPMELLELSQKDVSSFVNRRLELTCKLG